MKQGLCGTYRALMEIHFSDGTVYQKGEIIEVQTFWLTSGEAKVKTLSDGKEHMCFTITLLNQERI